MKINENKYFNILDEVRNIKNENEFIELDFKKYMINDRFINAIMCNDIEYLSNNFPNKVEKIKQYINMYPGVSLKFKFNDKKLANIKNWLRYKIIIYFKKYDCDKEYKKVVNYYFKDWENKYVDCIFSVYKLFFKFISIFKKNHKKDYSSIFNGKGRGLNWYFAMLQNIDVLYNIATPEEKEVFNNFDNLSKYTHTFGNYMPCPDGKYNNIKNTSYNDNIFELYSKNSYYKNWFNKNLEKYYLKYFKDNNYDNLIDYIDKCVNIIKERGKQIFTEKFIFCSKEVFSNGFYFIFKRFSLLVKAV